MLPWQQEYILAWLPAPAGKDALAQFSGWWKRVSVVPQKFGIPKAFVRQVCYYIWQKFTWGDNTLFCLQQLLMQICYPYAIFLYKSYTPWIQSAYFEDTVQELRQEVLVYLLTASYQDWLEELEGSTEPNVDMRVDSGGCSIKCVGYHKKGIRPNGEKFPVIGSWGRNGLVGFKKSFSGVPPIYYTVYIVVNPYGGIKREEHTWKWHRDMERGGGEEDAEARGMKLAVSDLNIWVLSGHDSWVKVYW